jgi:hypothetical protein
VLFTPVRELHNEKNNSNLGGTTVCTRYVFGRDGGAAPV